MLDVLYLIMLNRIMACNKDKEMKCAISAAIFFISLQLVISQCPQNCQNCSDTNQCSSCKVGYWGINFKCAYTCSNNCTSSNCDDSGYCYACVDGMYGPNCNQECRLCMNEVCGPRDCTSGCKIGYYQYISGDYSYCMPCPVNCQQCLNSTYCTLCDDGYYIYKSTSPSEPRRGYAECYTCQYKTTCDDCSRLSNCTQCSNDLVQTTCEHCNAGYTLNNSQCVKNTACSADCLNGCTVNGECNGCIDGATGITCDSRCYNRCAKCSQTNQYMCEACIDGFYTNTCNIPCPQNCVNRQCDFNHGSCLDGCLSAFWGDRCEDRCSDHCTQSECNRDGTCSRGCTAVYEGWYCNITITTKMTTVSTLSTTSGSAITITQRESATRGLTVGNCQEGSSISGSVLGGAVIGAVLITALLLGSIAFCMYRRLASKSGTLKEQRTDTMYYNTSVRSTANDETGFTNMASEMGTNQTPEMSVYDQLSRTNTEHEYSGL